MATLIGGSATQREKINNKTVRRCSVSVKMYRPTGATTAAPDLRAVRFKLTLKRNNITHTIFHDNLALLARESMYFSGFEYLETSGFPQLTTDGGGEYLILPIMLDLGSSINVQGTDELWFEMDCTSGWIPTGYTDLKCQIDAQWRDDIGVEKFIPFIKSIPIQADTANVKESLGDNISSVMLCNIAVIVTLSSDNSVFTGFSMTSDKYSVSDNVEHMIARRAGQFETALAANARGRNFMYSYPEVELDNVQINATMNAANADVSDNYIVYRTFMLDPLTMNRADSMEAKHQRRDIEKAAKQVKNAQ